MDSKDEERLKEAHENIRTDLNPLFKEVGLVKIEVLRRELRDVYKN
ncbi:MAG: hypothetical protein KAH07_07005 [Flavobacteriaceae bacterium]|nr:hypothetical protein [Flavobacteriaceae bacterium]